MGIQAAEDVCRVYNVVLCRPRPRHQNGKGTRIRRGLAEMGTSQEEDQEPDPLRRMVREEEILHDDFRRRGPRRCKSAYAPCGVPTSKGPQDELYNRADSRRIIQR